MSQNFKIFHHTNHLVSQNCIEFSFLSHSFGVLYIVFLLNHECFNCNVIELMSNSLAMKLIHMLLIGCEEYYLNEKNKIPGAKALIIYAHIFIMFLVLYYNKSAHVYIDYII